MAIRLKLSKKVITDVLIDLKFFITMLGTMVWREALHTNYSTVLLDYRHSLYSNLEINFDLMWLKNEVHIVLYFISC